MEVSQRFEFKSNIARDILQNSDNFSVPEKAIIEYVKNGYNYKQLNINSIVHVNCSSDSYVICDNGRGMSDNDLSNKFLIMHGENEDRKKGYMVDGLFGTGKIAAFGVGNILSIKTVKDGLLNHIEIHRKDIEKTKGTETVPIRQIAVNKKVEEEENGTQIEIRDLKKSAKKFNEKNIKKKIKDTIRMKNGVEVWFQNNKIEIHQPEIDFERKFETKDYKSLNDLLKKNSTLTIKVTKSPLEKSDSGICIYSQSVFHEATLAGQELKTFSDYIYGDIDVPELDDDHDIKSFLNDRSGLNNKSPLVRKLIEFVGNKIEDVYQILEDREKEKKDEHEKNKLHKLESDISKMLNEKAQRMVDQLDSKLFGSGKSNKLLGNVHKEMFKTGNTDSIIDGEFNAEIRLLSEKKIKKETKNNNFNNKNLGGEKKNSEKISRKSNSGGFSIKLQDLGEQENRGKWIAEENLILINLGHPQIKKLKDKGGTDNPFFNSLIFEVAMQEFAYGWTRLLMNEKKITEPIEALTNLRDVISDFATDASDII